MALVPTEASALKSASLIFVSSKINGIVWRGGQIRGCVQQTPIASTLQLKTTYFNRSVPVNRVNNNLVLTVKSDKEWLLELD